MKRREFLKATGAGVAAAFAPAIAGGEAPMQETVAPLFSEFLFGCGESSIEHLYIGSIKVDLIALANESPAVWVVVTDEDGDT